MKRQIIPVQQEKTMYIQSPIEFILGIWMILCKMFVTHPKIAALTAAVGCAFLGSVYMAGRSSSEVTTKIIVMKLPDPKDDDELPFVGNESQFIDQTQPVMPTVPAMTKKEFNSTTTYINHFAQRAVKDMQKYGVPASISIAQGILESKQGKSDLAIRFNNHFGMKCQSKRHRGCCAKYYDDSNSDSFIIFKTPEESWDAHSKLISSGRYAKLKKYGRDYRRWAYGLKSAGYATDRTYAQKLISIIERYDLYKFDRR